MFPFPVFFKNCYFLVIRERFSHTCVAVQRRVSEKSHFRVFVDYGDQLVVIRVKEIIFVKPRMLRNQTNVYILAVLKVEGFDIYYCFLT